MLFSETLPVQEALERRVRTACVDVISSNGLEWAAHRLDISKYGVETLIWRQSWPIALALHVAERLQVISLDSVASLELKTTHSTSDVVQTTLRLYGPNPTRQVQPTSRFCGSNPIRQSVGDPGHCEQCAQVGHEAAHPDLGCGDVGCYSNH